MPSTRRQAGPRVPLATALGAVLVAVLVVVGAGPASAHTRLTGSEPAAGAQLPVPPAEVVLTFNEAVQELGSQARLLRDGADVPLAEPLRFEGERVVQPLPADLPAGGYELGYRVVSADGHPVEGTVPFTAAGAAGTGPATSDAAATTTSPTTSDPAPTSDPGTSGSAAPVDPTAPAGGLPWWVGLLVVVAALGAVVAALARRRHDPGTHR